MKFTELKIKGAYLIEQEALTDERGIFSRQFCQNELEQIGIYFNIKQCSISKNYKKGTLRGMHKQKTPYSENKIVSCFKGAIFDVVVDLCEESETYLQWQGFELSESNNRMLFIPKNCAHGFQTLIDDTVLYYQIDEFFMPNYSAGVRYNDPKISIEWMQMDTLIINERDENYALIR